MVVVIVAVVVVAVVVVGVVVVVVLQMYFTRATQMSSITNSKSQWRTQAQLICICLDSQVHAGGGAVTSNQTIATKQCKSENSGPH